MDVLGSPAGVRGVDELGAVEIVLAADGLPHRIRPLAGWAQAARAERAGPAVGEAFAAAHRVHVAATAAKVAAAAKVAVSREGGRSRGGPQRRAHFAGTDGQGDSRVRIRAAAA